MATANFDSTVRSSETGKISRTGCSGPVARRTDSPAGTSQRRYWNQKQRPATPWMLATRELIPPVPMRGGRLQLVPAPRPASLTCTCLAPSGRDYPASRNGPLPQWSHPQSCGSPRIHGARELTQLFMRPLPACGRRTGLRSQACRPRRARRASAAACSRKTSRSAEDTALVEGPQRTGRLEFVRPHMQLRK